MGSLENPLLHCQSIREFFKKLRILHSELIDHENTVPKCEICWQNHAEFSSVKAQLYLIVQGNSFSNDKKAKDNLLEENGSEDEDSQIQPVTMVVVKEEHEIEEYSDEDQMYKSDAEDTVRKWNQSESNIEPSAKGSKQQRMSCPICSRTFLQRKRLANHMLVCKKHRGAGQDVDQIVEEDDPKVSDESNIKQFECAYCSKKFYEKSQIITHMQIHVMISGELENRTCKICNKRVHTAGGLKRHMRFHEKKENPNYKFKRSKKETQYSCNVCKKSFRYPGALERHMEIREGSNVNCKICGEKFCRNSDLDNHQRIAHEEKAETYQCHYCEEHFSNFKLIYKHHKSNHPTLLGPTKPFLCDTCGLAMMDSAHLKRHTMIHRGIKPHKCDVCDKAFRLKAELKQHRRVHIPASEIEEKYACPMCPKKFRTNVTLWRHKRFHSGKAVESFCPVCKLRITNPKSLEKHILRHASKGPRLFKCEECERTFTKLKYMNQHRKVDHNIFTHLMLNPKSSRKKTS